MFTEKETPKERADAAGLALQIAELQEIPIPQLNERYLQAFGVNPPVVHRQYLVRRIAWKLQASTLGGLSERAMLRASEIAKDVRFDDSDTLSIETRASSSRKRSRRHRDKRQPEPGSELTRVYKDRRIVVKVNANGFEYEGKQYPSLSAVARAATGTPWNGLIFFGLAKRGDTLKRTQPNQRSVKVPKPRKATGKVARRAA
jgi:hypothetical protein